MSASRRLTHSPQPLSSRLSLPRGAKCWATTVVSVTSTLGPSASAARSDESSAAAPPPSVQAATRARRARLAMRSLRRGPGLIERLHHVGFDELLVARAVPLAHRRRALVASDEDTEWHRLLRVVEARDARVLVEDDGELHPVPLDEGRHLGDRLRSVHRDADDDEPARLVRRVHGAQVREL